MRPVNRITPQLPAQAMQTYRIVSPADVFIKTVCEQVGCVAWRHGWDSIVDETSDLGMAQAAYFRSGQSGRSYRELGRRADGLTVFRFEARQRCFADHRTRAERYLVQGGDFRGNPRGIRPRLHTAPGHWVEDFAEHQQRLADAQQKG